MLTADTLNRVCDRVFSQVQSLSLEPGHIHFELVPPPTIQALASQGGLPVRYGHWSFGKSRQRLKTSFDFRMTQIYELVINHVPIYAFIDQTATPAQALMMVAHVSAHADYFRHHRGFFRVASDMVSVASRHRRTVEEYRQQFGFYAVESLLDAAHILADFSGDGLTQQSMGSSKTDVLGHVAKIGPRLKDWERQVLAMVWDEARYFWPQQLTRTANEGYATFCHLKMLHEMPMGATESWETAQLHASIVQVTPPRLNPYHLGQMLYAQAFNEGGWGSVFEARDLYEDVGLVRAYLTDELAKAAGLAIFRERDVGSVGRQASSDEIRRQMIQDLDHAGLPRLAIEDMGVELVLRHHYDGRDLDFAQLPFALKSVSQRIWKGPVVILTARQGVPHRVRHDGREFSDQAV